MRGYHGSVQCQLFPWGWFFVRIQSSSRTSCCVKGSNSRVGRSKTYYFEELEIYIEFPLDSLAYAIYSW